MTAFFLFVSIFAILIGRYVFLSFANPVSCFSFSFLLQIIIYFTFASMTNGHLHFALLWQQSTVLWLYSLSIIGFTLASVTAKRHRYIDKSSYFFSKVPCRTMALILQFEIVLILLVVAVLISYFGFPILQMVSGQVSIGDINDNITGLPFGILGVLVWLSFVVSIQFSIISNVEVFDLKTRVLSLIAVGLVVFASILYGKRQVVFAVIVFYTFMRFLSAKSSLKLAIRAISSVLIFGAFLSVYVWVQYVRTNGSGDGSGDFFVLELPLSAVWPLINFDRLISFYSPDNEFAGLISQIVPNRLFGHNTETIRSFLFEPTASASLLFYAYQDFGTVGVLAVSLVVGGVVRLFSGRRDDLMVDRGVKLLCLWGCLSVAFYSHIISTNFFLMPIFIVICLGYGYNYRGNR